MGVLLPDASGCSKEKWGGGWMRDKKMRVEERVKKNKQNEERERKKKEQL